MGFRRCIAIVVGLLLLTPMLAACAGGSSVEVGDVIPARNDAQFADQGVETTVALPIGRLEITTASAVAKLSADDTRQLEELSAPEGSRFVPVTWQYDAKTFGDLASFISSTTAPVIDLVVDGAAYRLPAPEQTGRGSESFYVLVDGKGENPTMTIDFGGVKQTANLATGKVQKRRAAALYDLAAPSSKRYPCAANPTFSRTLLGAATFSCEVTQAAFLPYAGSAWAAKGHRWLAITVATAQGGWSEVSSDYRSGALYYPTAVKSRFKLGGKAATEVILDRKRSTCPDLASASCNAVIHVVFDVTKEVPQDLTIVQDYELLRTSTWGTAKNRKKLNLTVTARATVQN